MRVVAGEARGRRLVTPEGDRTRPTSDRVREAIFNALWSRGLVDGARVLDLFAGSGALGIEALSRGASHATFVESDRSARRAIAANLAACGFVDRADVIGTTVERFLDELHRPERVGEAPRYDLAFCDPPYAYDAWDGLLAQLPAGFAVVESGRPVPPPRGWSLVRESRYGDTWVGLMSRSAT